MDRTFTEADVLPSFADRAYHIRLYKGPTEHFRWSEIACKRSGQIWWPTGAMETALFWSTFERAEWVRFQFGLPLVVRSGHRSRLHNTLIGGAVNSMHLKLALDLAPRWSDYPTEAQFGEAVYRLMLLAHKAGFTGIGRYNTFIHVDMRTLIGRPAAYWHEPLETWTPDKTQYGE